MPFTEREILRDLSGLLTADAAAEVHDAWSIGEQEGALALLVGRLAAQGTGVAEIDRARLVAIADHWGTLETLAPALLAIPAADDEMAPWETVEGSQRALRFEAELALEIAPGHVLAERVLTVWLASSCSDDLLVRVYSRKPWGGGWPTEAYAIVHLTWRGAPEPPAWPVTEAFDSVYLALEAFAERCAV